MAKTKKKKLNPKQQLFCQLYASDREFFGNGVESYIKAFSTKKKQVTYNVAKVLASRLLTKVYILDRINELMDIVINDTVVDKELAFVIKQKENLSAKVSAIREYNELKQRITKKLDVTSGGEKITQEVRTDPVLKKAVEFYERELKKEHRGRDNRRKPAGLDKRRKDKK